LRKFDYRSPRISVDLPIQLTIENSTFTARCMDISSQGMRLELLRPLPPDARGTALLRYRDITLELRVRVAHATAAEGGMEFLYNNNLERQAVAALLAMLAAS